MAKLSLHAFPARLAPELHMNLSVYCERMKLLAPMSGSGTSLHIASTVQQLGN